MHEHLKLVILGDIISVLKHKAILLIAFIFGVLLPETGCTSGYDFGVKKHKAKFFEIAFITFFFVCHQDKRPGVGEANNYLGFYGALAPETGYTRGYYLDC